MVVHDLHRGSDNVAHVQARPIATAVVNAECRDLRLECVTVPAGLLGGERQNTIRHSAAVAIPDGLQQSDEVPALRRSQLGGHAGVQEDNLHSARRPVPTKEQVPGVEVCVEEVVVEQHLKVAVLSARYDEVELLLHLGWRHTTTPFVCQHRRQLTNLEALYQHAGGREEHLGESCKGRFPLEVVIKQTEVVSLLLQVALPRHSGLELRDGRRGVQPPQGWEPVVKCAGDLAHEFEVEEQLLTDLGVPHLDSNALLAAARCVQLRNGAAGHRQLLQLCEVNRASIHTGRRSGLSPPRAPRQQADTLQLGDRVGEGVRRRSRLQLSQECAQNNGK
mmetsp:Transcript_39840/g.89901  ORF Transcript_39840/g.89901 Transcript_39840/m.89901 type:complete len:334 (+) Transcript_39840:324-1325(+)